MNLALYNYCKGSVLSFTQLQLNKVMLNIDILSNDSVDLIFKILPISFVVFLATVLFITKFGTIWIFKGKTSSFWRALLIAGSLITIRWSTYFTGREINIRRSEIDLWLIEMVVLGFLLGLYALFKPKKISKEIEEITSPPI